MATLSLNLGLLNLLPIPVLDGGHIFIMAIEGLARRDFSLKVKERLMLAGFVVLMVLMVTVMYNDLARISLFDRLIPGRSRGSPAAERRSASSIDQSHTDFQSASESVASRCSHRYCFSGIRPSLTSSHIFSSSAVRFRDG